LVSYLKGIIKSIGGQSAEEKVSTKLRKFQGKERKRSWRNNSRMDLKEIGCKVADWIQLAKTSPTSVRVDMGINLWGA
jgi:hypothetical protein